jgi:predicted nucleic acid-binding protein
VKSVFVDTSGFYAVLDADDPFHAVATAGFERAEQEQWQLVTTNYVVHETWALVQHRLGWDAVEDFLDVMLPLCRVEFVDQALHLLAAQRCRQSRRRKLSLTDCVSFEVMRRLQLTRAIAQDQHFSEGGIQLPE